MALIAAWAFDEGSGTTAADASGNGNTLTGVPGWSATGHTAAAMDVANTAGPNTAALTGTAAFTVMGWFLPDSITGWRSFFEESGASFYLEQNGGNIDVYQGAQNPAATTDCAVGVWIHIAYAQDSAGAGSLIINGVQENTASGSTITSLPSLDVGGSSAQPWDGRVDDVRLYNERLTAAQVATLMGQPVGGAGTTAVEQTHAASWEIAAAVEQTLAVSYDVASALVPVEQALAVSYDIDAGIDQPLALTWDVETLHFYITGTSPDGRHLTDQTGQPILLKGDTMWALVVNAGRWGEGGGATPEQVITHYADTRGTQGFNAVHLALLGHPQNNGPSADGLTWDGHSPWDGGVEGALNETYWQRVDWIIDECARNGITVFMDLMYQDDAATGALGSATTTECETYGLNVATRYLSRPNVGYSVGGDWFGDQDTKGSAAFTGVRAAGETRLFFVQNYPESTSRTDGKSGATQPLGDTWAQLNYVYTYDVTYNDVEQAWAEPAPIPVVWGDGHYDAGAAERTLMRNLFGWSLTSGGVGGHMLGTESTWGWPAGAYDALTNANGNGQDLPAMRTIFEGIDRWWDLVPDIGGTFITAGRGTKSTYVTSSGGSGGEYNNADAQNTYVTGGVTPDGTLAVIYHPAATTRSITIDQSKMGAGYTARWVDPTDGTSTPETPAATYTKTGTNAAGGTDWLLVLEATEAAPTPVEQGLPLTYDVAAGVEATHAVAYDVLAEAQQILAASWDVLAEAEQALAATWDIAEQVDQALPVTYDVDSALTPLDAPLPTSWNVDAAIEQPHAVTYDVLTVVEQDLTLDYDLRQQAEQELATSWDIDAAIAQLLTITWDVDSEGHPEGTLTARRLPATMTATRLPATITARRLT